MIVSSPVPPATQPQPLLDYLAGRFTYLPRKAWAELIGEGKVLLNGRLPTPDVLIQPQDLIRCDLPDYVPDDVTLDYEIVHEDEWLLGVNKPSNLRVHSSGKFVQANLIYLLRQRFPTAQLINRLDADTSGVVLVARDGETAALVGQQFAAGTVFKQYVALVHGVPQPAEGTMAWPLGKISGKRRPMRYGVVSEAEGGKTAVTHYTTRQTFGEQAALLELRPETGRTHQLRVHLATLGYPIISDKLYRFSEAEFARWIAERTLPPHAFGLRHHALHCAQTRIIHPHTQTELTVAAPLSQPFAALLNRLPPD